jgi:hypothetical protein
MPTRYTRFGELFMQGLAKALAEGTTIEVPHVGSCRVSHVADPRMHHSNWSMHVSIAFPNSHSDMTVGLYTFGSCLMDDTESISLPEPTFVDENDTIFPREHQDAWYRLLDSLEAELESGGYKVGSADNCDIYLITDYMPSEGISASLLNVSSAKPELLSICQSLVRKEPKWKFWIRLGFDFVDERHKGDSESILVRPDRIVHDYDAVRLLEEFGADLPALIAP